MNPSTHASGLFLNHNLTLTLNPFSGLKGIKSKSKIMIKRWAAQVIRTCFC